MANSKPRVFIGSSSEGLEIATTLQAAIASFCEPTVWSQGVFGLGVNIIDQLLENATNAEFAILVLTPDDLTTSRGRRNSAPRDNVLFELGLFMGMVGKTRTFIVHPDDQELKIPSDLAGIVTTRYDAARENILAALGPVSLEIKRAIQREITQYGRPKEGGSVVIERIIQLCPSDVQEADLTTLYKSRFINDGQLKRLGEIIQDAKNAAAKKRR